SYEEYKELVESSDQRYELIDGQVYLLASPSFNHQVIVNELAGQFYNFFKEKSCQSLTAPLDIKLFGYATKFEENPNVVQPDIVIICDQDKINDKNKYEGIPSLIVEVLSPSTKGKDMVTKLNLYMECGVSEYWIVDIDNEKFIQYSFQKRDLNNLRFVQKKGVITSTYFEGLKIKLQDIFTAI
ncbi:MAG: Uma2 family endonuclease, partial [bacterium]